MANVAPYVCVLLLLFGWPQQQSVSANPFLATKKLIEFGFSLQDDYEKIKNLFKLQFKEVVQDTSMGELKILDQIDEVSNEIQNLRNNINHKLDTMDTKLTTATGKLQVAFDKMSQHYHKYENNFKNGIVGWNKETLKDFYTKTKIMSEDTIDPMHTTFLNKDIDTDSIVSLISKNLKDKLMCRRDQSPQQLIYELYQSIILTDTKYLITELFAYEMHEKRFNSTLEREKKQAVEDYLERINQLYDPVKYALEKASRDLWKCNAETEVKGETYENLEVFKGIVHHEKDTIGQHRCYGTCESPTKYPLTCETDFCREDPKERMCGGRMVDCVSLDYDDTICFSNSRDRRYEWIKTVKIGGQYGKVGDCEAKERQLSKKYFDLIAYDLSTSIRECSYCLCTCENSRTGIRRFSLAQTVSDLDDNKVVTGVRFRLLGNGRENNTFYIEIQQGRLGANGSIDQSTVKWKLAKMNDDDDFYEVNWDQRTVYLDDLVIPQSDSFEVVSGLRFKHVGSGDLKLEIERAAFNFTTGEFLDVRPHWMSKDLNRQRRTQLKLKAPINPLTMTKKPGPDDILPDSNSEQYVQFRATDYKKDVGQATIPYIDMQPITTIPPMPITGAGIYHKGTGDSGGFLGLKIIHVNLVRYMEHNKVLLKPVK